MELPGELVRRVRGVHGDAGRAWIEDLPRLLEEAADRWGLRLEEPFEALTYNFVCPVWRADGSAAVLKAGVPCPELTTEAAALLWWDGEGAVRLLQADTARGLLLLERLRPGRLLLDVDDDDEATGIGAGVMRRLRRPTPEGHAFPHVRDWLEGFKKLRATFEGGTGPFPAKLVELAERTSVELFASQVDDDIVLHGDVHHWNVLSADREPWLAIDPHGVVGEPAYETGAWLRNPVGMLLNRDRPGAVLERRIAILSNELGFTRERIRKWGAVHAVLSAWWTYEGEAHPGEEALEVARLLTGIGD
jgi:streptomycin 6-kinase